MLSSSSISLLLPHVLRLLCIVKDLLGLVGTVVAAGGGWITVWGHVVGARSRVPTLYRQVRV